MRASKGVPRPLAWVKDWERGDEFVEHWRGVSWAEARMPKPSHECEAQTRGAVRLAGLPRLVISRCACGAVNLHYGDGWESKNSRSS